MSATHMTCAQTTEWVALDPDMDRVVTPSTKRLQLVGLLPAEVAIAVGMGNVEDTTAAAGFAAIAGPPHNLGAQRVPGVAFQIGRVRGAVLPHAQRSRLFGSSSPLLSPLRMVAHVWH